MIFRDPDFRPKVGPPLFEHVPAELKNLPQWVLWRFDWNKHTKQWAKVPYDAHTLGKAKSDDPSTWASFDSIQTIYVEGKGGFDGIGFVFFVGYPYCGVDFDNCLKGNQINDVAREWVERFDSYTEKSVSQTGLHIICKGMVGKGMKVGDFEIYSSGRYFTFSGNVGKRKVIESRQSVIDDFKNFLRPEKPKNELQADFQQPGKEQKTAVSLHDRLEKAFKSQNGPKIRALHDGNISGYPSPSEADLAYCSLAAFWTGGDASVLDQMYRTSRLMRDKWEREDYRNETISKALGSCLEFYDFSRNGNGHHAIDVNRQSPLCSADHVVKKTTLEEERATDLGNARRLVRLHQPDLRYCYDFKKWLVWDKRRWRVDSTGGAVRRAKATVQSIYKEVHDAPDDQRKQLASWAIRSESDRGIQAMLSLTQSEPGIPVLADQLDVDSMLLNCRNGTLDLRTGKLNKHERGNYITKVIEVDYDPKAACPQWDDFLDRIMAGNVHLTDFLRQAVGYSLTGDVSERILFILYGTGANGKSVFVETLTALLGDYATRTPTSTLMVKRDASIPNDVARLKGTRFVHACESEEGKRLAESEIKDLTGGDTISARYMRAEWFDFKPEFKLWLRTNHKPVVRGTDEAIWDRLKLIPFSVRIEKHEQDKGLSKKLLAELPGILAWAVRGCLEWQRDGLGVPNEVTTATEGYRTEMDSFAGFVEECCVTGDGQWVASKTLRECYESWGSDRGDRWLLGGRAFTDRLKALRCAPQTVNRVRGWRGIGLEG